MLEKKEPQKTGRNGGADASGGIVPCRKVLQQIVETQLHQSNSWN
jgi:hypothetical protein